MASRSEEEEEMSVSGGSTSEEEEDNDDEEEDEEETSSDSPTPPPRQLPSRATRGLRMTQALQDADSGDEEFWNQDFFAEDAADQEYETESAPSDDNVAGSDFSETEDEEDEDAAAAAAEAEEEAEERRRGVGGKKKAPLRPPGASAAAAPSSSSLLPPMAMTAAARAKQRDADADAAAKARSKAAAAEARAQRVAAAAALPPPSVRASTAARTAAVAEARAREADAAAARKKSMEASAAAATAGAAGAGASSDQHQQQQQLQHWPATSRRLTQHELLAEAAATEVANLADLDVLLAQEEEVKRRAHAAARAAYRGPRLRTLSRIVDGREQTVVAALDMPLPEDYIRRLAPPPRNDDLFKCVVTGLPAKYRDPVTGAPYATVEAFKTLRERAAAAAEAAKAAAAANDATGRPGAFAAVTPAPAPRRVDLGLGNLKLNDGSNVASVRFAQLFPPAADGVGNNGSVPLVASPPIWAPGTSAPAPKGRRSVAQRRRTTGEQQQQGGAAAAPSTSAWARAAQRLCGVAVAPFVPDAPSGALASNGGADPPGSKMPFSDFILK